MTANSTRVKADFSHIVICFIGPPRTSQTYLTAESKEGMARVKRAWSADSERNDRTGAFALL
jgi:hypothetical protein